MQALWALGVFLCINFTTQGCYSAMQEPHQPYGHYLEWCNDRYSPTNNTANLAANLYFTSNPAQPLQLNSDWVPEWVAQWQPFNSTACVLQGKDLADLPGDSLSWVKAILNKLHDVVQERLQTKARLQPDKAWSPSLVRYPKGDQGFLRSGLRGPSLVGQG
jgi:hypothetical protein